MDDKTIEVGETVVDNSQMDPSLTEYTKRDGGSCEVFKIEIKNLPSFANYTSIKKLISNKFHVKPHKIKIAGGPRSKIAFVAFTCESDRKSVLEGIKGYVWKGKQLDSAVASPLLDPFLFKQIQERREKTVQDGEDGSNEPPARKRSKLDEERNVDSEVMEEKSVEERLREQVAPLAGTAYEVQLEMKKTEHVSLLQDLLRSILKIINQSVKSSDRRCDSRSDDLLKWFVERRKCDHLFCPIGDVVECPIDGRIGYRNKCEFSFGKCGISEETVTVGFRLGAYKHGNVYVAPIDSSSLIPQIMKNIVHNFHKFINDQAIGFKLLPFDHVTHEGNLTQLTVRTNSTGQSMVILFVNPQSFNDHHLHSEMTKIQDYFKSRDELGIVSFFLQKVMKTQSPKPTLIYGSPVLTEELSIKGKCYKFNISPNAFFQINTKAAESCYGSIRDLLGLESESQHTGSQSIKDESTGSQSIKDGDTENEGTKGESMKNDGTENGAKDAKQSRIVLLDICCGTGTIGLCLASECEHVFGIELSKEAVLDARENARLNNISNATFYDGKAESVVPLVIQTIQRQYPESEVVAILDPPRAGLNSSLIKSVRSTVQISKLIYVSCEPRLAKNNMIDLVRPVSKAYRGDPFIPVKSTLVDMFPDTKRAETLFLFQRLPSGSLSSK